MRPWVLPILLGSYAYVAAQFSAALITPFTLAIDANLSSVVSATAIFPPVTISLITTAIDENPGLSANYYLDSPDVDIGASLATSAGSQSEFLRGTTAILTTCASAAFADLQIDQVGTYILTFTSLTFNVSIQSIFFQVHYGRPSALILSAPPQGIRALWPFQQQPVIKVQDSGSNILPFGDSIIVEVLIYKSVDTSLQFVSDTSTTMANGSADFSKVKCFQCQTSAERGLALSNPAQAVQLKFSADGILPTFSSTFDVGAWPPVSLQILTINSQLKAAAPFEVQPSISLVDKSGYLVSWASDMPIQVSAQIQDRVGVPNTLSGGTLVPIVQGIATFTDLELKYANDGYVFEFQAFTALPFAITGIKSLACTITFGYPYQLGLQNSYGSVKKSGVQPKGGVAALPLSAQPVAVIQDSAGNWVQNVSINVTAELFNKNNQPENPSDFVGRKTVISCHPPAGSNPARCDCAGPPSNCGFAQFSDLTVLKAGSGFRINFTASILRPVLSDPFDIAVGQPVKLGILQEPAGFLAGYLFQTQPIVAIQDQGGNVVNNSVLVIFADIIQTYSLNQSISRLSSKKVENGVAKFSNLTITKTGLGFVLIFSTSGKIKSTSSKPFSVASFPIALEPIMKLQKLHAAQSLSLEVDVVDIGGLLSDFNPANKSLAASVLLCSYQEQSLNVDSGDADWFCNSDNLNGTTLQNCSGGIANFTDLSILKSGSWKLHFIAGALQGWSPEFNILNGEPDHLAFLNSVSAQNMAGVPLLRQPIVTLQDLGGNNLTDELGMTVTASLRLNGFAIDSLLMFIPDLPPTIPLKFGVAAFYGLRIDFANRDYSLEFVASIRTIPALVSDLFEVLVGEASALHLDVQPLGCSKKSMTQNVSCTFYPNISIRDNGGNVVTVNISNFVVAANILNMTDGSTLAELPKASPVNGICSWTDLVISKHGNAFALRFSSSGLRQTLSRTFSISLPPVSIVVLADIRGTIPGYPIAQQPSVTFVDMFGSVAEAENNSIVQATLETNSSTLQRTLKGTREVKSHYGVVYFTNLQIDQVGRCLFLRYSSVGMISALSTWFSVEIAPSAAIVIEQQPSQAVPGQVLGIQPRVSLRDAGHNLVTLENGIFVTASIFGLAPSALQGNTVKEFFQGLADFDELRTDISSGCMQFVFSSNGKQSVKSNPIEVFPLEPVQLKILDAFQPNGAAPGKPLSVQPVIIALDRFGNQNLNTSGVVHASLYYKGNAADCATNYQCLLGSDEASFGPNGAAAFTDLRIDKANDIGYNYSIFFESGERKPVESLQVLTVQAGKQALQLGIVREPRAFAVNKTIEIQPWIGAVDEGGNVVPSIGTFAVNAGILGTDTSNLAGRTQILLNQGVARFTDLLIKTIQKNLTLKFEVQAGGLNPVSTKAFDVAGPLSRLTLIVQPISAAPGQAFLQQPQVQGLDAAGGVVTASPGNITVTLISQPISLAGTRQVRYLNTGIAIFTDLRIDTVPSSGYFQLQFATSALSVLSDPVPMSSSRAVKLNLLTRVFRNATSLQPLEPQPVIAVLDFYDNFVLNSVISVTASLVYNRTGGNLTVLSGVSVVRAVKGVAQFTDLSVIPAVEQSLLVFSSGTLLPSSSVPFSIAAGEPARLILLSAPRRFYVNQPLSPQPRLSVVDSSNNVVPIDGNVTVEMISGCTNASASCGGAVGGLAAIQPYCVSRVLEENMSAYCRAALDSDQSNGTITVEQMESNSMMVSWILAGPSYINENSFNYSISVATNASIVLGQCIGILNGSINFSNMFSNQANDISTLLDGQSSNQSVLIIPTVANLLKLLNYSGFPQQILIVSAAGTQLVQGSCGSISYIQQALVSGACQFQGLEITTVQNSVRLRFRFQLLQVTTDAFAVSSQARKLALIQSSAAVVQGGTPFLFQPSVVVRDSGDRLLTYQDYTVSASLVASDGSTSCGVQSGQFTYRCGNGAFVCAFSPEFCPKLIGTTQVNTSFGVAHFTNLAITTCNDASFLTFSKYSCIRGLYSISFQAYLPWSLTGISFLTSSSSIEVTIGLPAGLAVNVQPPPSNTAGVTLSSQPVLIVLDSGQNRVASGDTKIYVAASLFFTVPKSNTTVINPSLVSGTTEIVALLGAATFTNLAVVYAGRGLSLQFSMRMYNGSTNSGAFTVLAGKPYMLKVWKQPALAYGGELFLTAPEIQICDMWSNVVDVKLSITASLYADAQAPAFLLNLDANASMFSPVIKKSFNGTVSFSSLAVDKIGFCYRLQFTSSGLVSAISDAFDVQEGTPYQLRILRQPNDAAPGYLLATQPIVWVCDRGGNLNSYRYSGDVLAEPVSASPPFSALPSNLLKGTRQLPSSGGQVVWTDLRIDRVASNYSLAFSAVYGAMQVAYSAGFDVSPGVPFALAISRQPNGAAPGHFLSVQPEVEVQDSVGNAVDVQGLIISTVLKQNGVVVNRSTTASPCEIYHCTMQCTPGALCANALIRCPTCFPVQAVMMAGAATTKGGLANFTWLAVENVGTNFTMQFSSGNLVPAESQVFDVVLGRGVQVRILQAAFGLLSGAPFRIQPIVALQDIGNNTVDSSGSVQVSLSGGPGNISLPSISPDENRNVFITRGTAFFVNLAVSGPGKNLFLVFKSFSCFGGNECMPAISEPFNVSNTARYLTMGINPVGNYVGRALAVQPQIHIVDEEGLLVDWDDGRIVQVTLLSSGLARNASLLGQSTVVCLSGICSFLDLRIDKAASNFSLFFTSSPLQPVSSMPFSIVGPTRLVIVREPGGSLAGKTLATQPTVAITDAAGLSNILPDTTVIVSVAIRPGSGSIESNLFGRTTADAVGGIAIFTDLTLDTAGSRFVLVFSAEFLESAYSEPFDSDYEMRPGICDTGVCVS